MASPKSYTKESKWMDNETVNRYKKMGSEKRVKKRQDVKTGKM